METVNVHQAKTQFSRLLARVELGEEVIIANRGVPVAKLVPVQPTLARRASLGLDQGRFTVPDDFDAPLADELLAAFEGSEG
jgi:prevent-host-death family protein